MDGTNDMSEGQEQRDSEGMYLSQGVQPAVDDSLGSLRLQLDHREIIEEFMHNLKNEELVQFPDGKVGYENVSGATPLLNDKGVGLILLTLRSRVNKVSILSDLDAGVINRMCKYIDEDLTMQFMLNWQNIGIESNAGAHLIIGNTCDMVESTLSKGKDGNYMKLLRHIYAFQELKNTGGAGAKSSMMNMPNQGSSPGVTDSIMRLFGKK